MPVARSSDWKRATIALLLFSVSFGYLEAAVVAYLRALNEPVRQRFNPGREPDDMFPLLKLDQVKAAGPELVWLLKIELAREAATLFMLAAVGIMVGRNGGQTLAAFSIAFGTWDIAFYAFLRLLLHWPRSLLTWDLLFLIPVPWAAPVMGPVLVSLSMIGAGFVYLGLEWTGRRARLRPLHWLGVFTGGLILMIAFTWDFHNITAGGMPHPFNWPLFALGEMTGLGAFLHAILTRSDEC